MATGVPDRKDSVWIKNPEMFQPLTQDQWQSLARYPAECEMLFVNTNKCLAILHLLGKKFVFQPLCIEVSCYFCVLPTGN